MDSYADSTPPKKICISNNVDDMQLKERVLQQLPTMKQTDSIANWKFRKNQKFFPRLSTSKLTNFGCQIVPGGEYQVSNKSPKLETPNKLQKLRILSPKGRDLGEFNVELRANNPLKGKTVKIVKPMKKVVIVSLSNEELSQVSKQSTPRISQVNLIPNVDSTSCDKTTCGVNETNTVTSQQHFAILPKNKMFINDCAEINEEKQLYNSDITSSGVNKASTSETNHKNSIYYTDNEQNHSEINDVNNYLKIQEVTSKNNKVSTDAKILINAEISKSQFLLNCKKHEINSNDKYEHSKTSKRECIAVIKKMKDGKIITSLKNARKIDRNLNQDNLDNNKQSFNNGEVLSNKNNLFQIKPELSSTNNQVHEVKPQKNVMTIIPNNEKHFNQNIVLSQERDVAISSTKCMTLGNNTNSQDTESDNMRSKNTSNKNFKDACFNVTIDNYTYNSEIQQIADIKSTSVRSNLQDKTYRQSYHKDLSNQYDIIQRAMDCVKDNELRELALKALMDCGIGIQKYIPMHSSQQQKSVCDTQVQTEVFGLLDPKSFILINKDMDNINRINQINLQDISGGQNLLTNNLCSSDSIPNIPDVCEQQNVFDVNNFLKHFEENLDVVKIKDTLSTTMKKHRDLVDYLQKDFESVKQYDENGMLNIHKAVISNNIYPVLRQLMILKCCKESVDILTKNGLTSLELAIKYDICSEIVQLLLEAKAQPVIPKYIHESALIIASKQSSPLLSILVKFISDLKLLDLTDSEGLAALHYCSMRGNLEGVNALLSAGANMDLKDAKSGRTPLFHAMDNNHTLVAQALLKAGAVANIANYAGQTPLPIMTETRSAPFRISMQMNT